MRPLLAALLMLAAVVAAVVAVPAAAATRTVAVRDFRFSPSSLKVTAGTTVTWKVGGDGVSHNITVLSGPVRFHSRSAAKYTFSKRLTRKGTYKLHCTIHPSMHQTIIVS